MEKLFGEQDLTNENTIEGRKTDVVVKRVFEYFIERYSEEIQMQEVRKKFAYLDVKELDKILYRLANEKKIEFMTEWTMRLAVAYECYECNTRMTLSEFRSMEHAQLHIAKWLNGQVITLEEHATQMIENPLHMNTLKNIKEDSSRTNRSKLRNGF